MRSAFSIIRFCAIVFALFGQHDSLSQDRRYEERSRQPALRQLHPEPVVSDPPTGIKLLPGYKNRTAIDFEGNQVGEISNDDGFTIKYEIGFSQGMAADPNQKASYVWYREHQLNSRMVAAALRKDNVLVISIPLDNSPNTLHAANVYGTIRKSVDVAEMLLMISPLAYR